MNGEEKTPLGVSIWDVAKRFLTIFLPSAALVGGIAMIFYYKDVRAVRLILETQEVEIINHQREIIVNDFMSVVSDLMFLSEYIGLQHMIESGNAGEIKEQVSREFLSFSEKRGLYDQIRFLDERGMEALRVNANDGKPYIVPEEQLQSKATRYYFKETFSFRQGEVFVSPFDLNIEGGEIEQPLKPTIRFGTTVFDSHGQKRGVVILNYLGMKLINNLKSAHASSSGYVLLLNSDGFYLHGPRPQEEWGFMYEDRKDRTFKNAFQEVWRQISGTEYGQFHGAKGIFTFATVYPTLEALKLSIGSEKAFDFNEDQAKYKAHYWKLLSHISPNVLNAVSSKLFNRLLLIYATLIVPLAFGSWYLASLSESRRLTRESLFKSEAELRQHRDKLEEMIDDRTAKLKRANEQLQREIIEHNRTEGELRRKSQELEVLAEDLRKLSSQLSKKEELSRRKFAKILHEQVGQNLAAMRIKCHNILEETISDREGIKETIQNLIPLLNDTMRSTKELTSDLYPVVLDNLGFVPAVTWYSDLVLKPNRLKVLLDIDECVEGLPSESKLLLFRIVQEGFQNIAKHSKATEVEVVLKRLDSSMRLSIKDNGVGFDYGKTEKKMGKGIGLMLIKESSLSLGGSFKVKSVLKRGTEFTVEIPVT